LKPYLPDLQLFRVIETQVQIHRRSEEKGSLLADERDEAGIAVERGVTVEVEG